MRLGCLCALLACVGCGFSVQATPDARAGDAAPDDGAMGDAPVDGPPFTGTSPRKLVFANAASNVDLLDFPVLVLLTPQHIDYAQVGDPLTELRFEDLSAGASDLPYDVETWNPGGVSAIWVQVPEIVAGSDDDFILMHFGAGENGTHDPETVWESYELVAHLGASLSDAAGNGHDGATTIPVMPATGRVGDASRFTGTPMQRIAFAGTGGLVSGWQAFAFELWIRPAYTNVINVTGEPDVISKGLTLNNGRMFRSGSNLTYQVDVTFENGTRYLNGAAPLGTWTHFVYACDGTTLRFYRDGVLAGSDGTSGSGLLSSTSQLILGGQTPLVGEIDELRLSATNRGPDWIRAQHLTMTDQFVTFTDP